MGKKYYMVRAMESTENDFKVFFENNVIAVGWSDVNFRNFEKNQGDNLVEAVKKQYYSSSNLFSPWVGKKLNEVRRFHKINGGDYIIIPYYSSIRLAIAEENIFYSEPDYKFDLANQRKVRYITQKGKLKTIPRDVLSEGLQRRLRVRGSTVTDLLEFKEEIEKLFDKANYSWTVDFEEKENTIKSLLKYKLLSKIKEGKTNLQTGGIGLENLVKELYECEGYQAEVLAKTTFKIENADADVHAVKSDKFQEVKILTQVKHHNGYTDGWGLEQLSKIKQSVEYKEYIFVLITSAEISDDVRKIAKKLEIAAIDGNELVDWIIEHSSKLEPETKIKLGLSSVPQLIE